MTFRSLPVRIAFVAVAAVAANCESTAEAQFGTYYNYYTGYAPATYTSYYAPTVTSYYGGYWNGPLGLGVAPRIAARRAYRWGGYYGGYAYGYGGNCCGTCSVTANFAPSCGCAVSCGCSPCSCVSGCASGECGLSSSPSDTVVNSVPSDVEPTPVTPKKDRPSSTFDSEPLDDDPAGFRPSDRFQPNNGDNGTGAGANTLPDEFDQPLNTNPGFDPGPVNNGGGSDFDFNPDATDGPINQFKPAPADGSAVLPSGDVSIASRFEVLPSVSVARGRTLVRARFGIPALAARDHSIETVQPFSTTNLALAD